MEPKTQRRLTEKGIVFTTILEYFPQLKPNVQVEMCSQEILNRLAQRREEDVGEA